MLRTADSWRTMWDMSVVLRGVGARSDSSERRLWLSFAADCALGVTVRLVLAVATIGYSPDTQTFQSWAETLRDRPLHDFYGAAYRPDHLPGDLWILKLTAWTYDALGGRNLEGDGFALATQVVPILGDLLVAVMLVLLVRELRDLPSAARVARWYLLNPATIFVSAVWGQWDSVSLGIVLTGVWLTMRPKVWLVSPVFLTWAVLIKPQLALPCLCVALVLAHRLLEDGLSRRALAARGAGFAVLATATAYAVVRPFGVGLVQAPAGGSTLADRLTDALDVWPFTTVGAANVWMLPIRSLDRRPDTTPGWLGLSPEDWGTILLLVAVVAVATLALARLRPAGAVAAGWVGTTVAFAAFLFPTRVHERYLFPALVIGLLLAAFSGWDRRLVAWFWATSAVLFVNLVMVLFGGFHGPRGRTFTFGSSAWLLTSLGMVALFLAIMAWPLWPSRRDSRAAPVRV